MTLAEAVIKYKLDKRRRWFSFCGNVVYDHKYTTICSGCSESKEYSSRTTGVGCDECGYTGKTRSSCPVPGRNERGNPIEITEKDFVKFNNFKNDTKTKG